MIISKSYKNTIMSSRGGRQTDSRRSSVVTRSRANEMRQQQDDTYNALSDQEEARGFAGTSFQQTPDEVDQLTRARMGLQRIEAARSFERSGENIQIDNEGSSQSVPVEEPGQYVPMERVQELIDASVKAQTDRLTAMFNQMLVDHFASFETPPRNFGFPPNQMPTRFNDSNFENHIPRQSVVTFAPIPGHSNAQEQEQQSTIAPHNSTQIQGIETDINSLGVTSAVPTQPVIRHAAPFPEFQARRPNRPESFNPTQFQPAGLNVNTTRFGASMSPPPIPRHTCPPQQPQLQIPRQGHPENFIPIPIQFNNTNQDQENQNNFNETYHLNNPYESNPQQTSFKPYQRMPGPFYPTLPKNGLHSWDLKYDGTTSIERFIMKVDIIRQANFMSWDYIVSQFHCLIKKPADRWYWSWVYGKQRENIQVTWSLLKEALISHFSLCQTDEDFARQLHDKRQKPNEKFGDFFEDFMSIHDCLKYPKSDQELISILKRNVSNRLFNLTYNINAPDIDTFRVMVCRVELDLESRYTSMPYIPSKFKDVKRVSELDMPIKEKDEVKDELVIEVDELKYKGDKNFEKPFSKNHKENEIYCYKCDYPGVKYPSCPRCQNQENSKESGIQGKTSHSE